MDATHNAHVHFLPWVGECFYTSDTRLLVVGESHYGFDGAADRNLTVRLTGEYARGEWTDRFWTKISQVITGKMPLAIDRYKLWHSIAFYNYVQEVVASGPRMAPTDDMFRKSESAFFEALAHIRPTHLIALGYRLWYRMPEFTGPSGHFVVSGESYKWGSYTTGKSSAVATVIQHPSSAFSPSRWHQIVKQFLKFQGDS